MKPGTSTTPSKKAAAKKTKPDAKNSRHAAAIRAAANEPRASAAENPAEAVDAIVATLRGMGTAKFRDQMTNQFGIRLPDPARAFGVPVARIRALAKTLVKGRAPTARHALAAALWDSGWYEARLLCAFVDDPALVTPAQMNRWCRAFDNWAVCDTLCFHLFDKTPHALDRVGAWAMKRPEFERRAAFALLASLALHDKTLPDGPFLAALPLVDRAADDDRNFVKKAVSWALRAMATRSAALRAAVLDLANTLADAGEPARRWIGKDVLRELAAKRARS